MGLDSEFRWVIFLCLSSNTQPCFTLQSQISSSLVRDSVRAGRREPAQLGNSGPPLRGSDPTWSWCLASVPPTTRCSPWRSCRSGLQFLVSQISGVARLQGWCAQLWKFPFSMKWFQFAPIYSPAAGFWSGSFLWQKAWMFIMNAVSF